MQYEKKVLVINPGSTSTKLALYLLDGARAWQQEIIHPEHARRRPLLVP